MDDSSRREFIRSFGIAFLAVAGGRALAGCRRGTEAVDAPRPVDTASDAGIGTPAVTPVGPPVADAGLAPAPDAPTATTATTADERARVRKLWLELVPEPTAEDWLEYQGTDSPDPRPAREAAHREALDRLVAGGDLRGPIADLVQLAFAEVSFHAWRLRIGSTCYDPTQLGWQLQQSRERLCERARLLDELVRGGSVAADAVADARTALARELAVYDAAAVFAKLEGQPRWDQENALSATLAAGGLTPDADELEAAGWLVELLLAAPRTP
jgi:hypothetical protein